jgi:putative membrane protein
MSKRFIDDEAKRAFTDAIESVEACSSAEVVIAVRHHSGSYLHADVIVGAIAAWAALAFTLYSPYEFSLASILVDPLIAGALFGMFNTQLPMVRRALTLPERRRRRVVTSARAAFYEKGIRMTTDRTGMLVYISLLERAVEVVIDNGVRDAVPKTEWALATARIESTLRHTMDANAVAEKIADLGRICEAVMIRSEDDVNELPDEVCAP